MIVRDTVSWQLPRGYLPGLVVLVAGYLLALPALSASAGGGAEVNWLGMGMGLFGGLALFLYGMEKMGDGLKAAAGEQMKTVLAKLTTNRVTAAITGAFVTAIIQSSSVTTVLVVGFISAGLMSLTQSIGVIMGANIGTTVTAQIVAFKVTKAALAMIAVGFAMSFGGRSDKMRHYGDILMGLGLVFFGMNVMSDAMAPLRSFEPFLDLMQQMENPLLGILVAAAFTALVQSSSATTGIVIVMASQGFITLPAGIAMAFGANIGTCVTALLAAIGKPVEALRASMVHVLFNVLGVALWIAFIPHLAEFAVQLSPQSTGLSGAEQLAADAPRQIANANTLFNLANTLLFLPAAGLMGALVTRMVREKPVPEGVLIEAKYLDRELLATPVLALERVRMEFGHLGEMLVALFAETRPALQSRDSARFDQLVVMADELDLLYDQIIVYMGELRQQGLSDEESEDFIGLTGAVDNLQSMADVIRQDLVGIARRAVEADVVASDTMRAALKELGEDVQNATVEAIAAVTDNDEATARRVIQVKDAIRRKSDDVLRYQADKLSDPDPRRLVIFRLEMELVDNLRRMYTLAKRIAKIVLPGTKTD